MAVPIHWLLFPHSCEHRKTPVCQSLCCWFMWVTVQSLQGSTSAVLIWSWKAEVILWSQGQCHFTWTRWSGPGKSQCLQREEKGERPWWEEEPCELECQIAKGIPSYLVKNQQTGLLMSPPSELTSSHHPCNGSSFMYQCMCWADKVCHHHPVKTYSESKWQWESVTECKVSATGPASDRWHSSRLGQ